MKPLFVLSIFILFLIMGCSQSIKQAQNSSIENFLIGIETLMHDGNTSLAIPKFNEDFVSVNSNVSIVSVIEDYYPGKDEWIFDQRIESLYGNNGNLIKRTDATTVGAIRKVMEQYTYNNDFLQEKIETHLDFKNQYSYFKEEYFYNNLGKPDSTLEFSKINDPWKYSTHSFYEYDSLGRLAEFSYQPWSGLYNRWHNGYKEEYFYYEDSTIVLHYSQSDDKDYVLYRKTDSLFQNRKFVGEIVFELDKRTWDTVRFTKIGYDEIGNKTSESIFNFKDKSSDYTEYVYNTYNQRVKKTIKSSFYLEGFNHKYVEEYKDIYKYNEAGYLEEIILYNKAKCVFGYDKYGFINSIVFYYLDEERNEYVKASRISQTYKI